jgi:hypothetical protein
LFAFNSPDTFIYCIDEQTLWEQSLFIHFGITPLELQWPGMFVSFLLYGFSYISLCIETPFLNQLLSFNIIDADNTLNNHVYMLMDSGRGIIWARILVLIFKISSLAIIYKLLSEKDTFSRFFYCFLCIVSFGLVIQNSSVHPDSFAIYIWLVLFTFFTTKFNNTPKHIVIMSLLFATLCATRLTYIIAFPFFIVYGFWGKSFNWRHLGYWVIPFSLCFIAFCPYTLLTPVTFLKSFASNYIAISGRNSALNPVFALFSDYLPSLVNYIGLVLAIIGLVILYNTKRKLLTFLVILLILFGAPLLITSSSAIRYTMPLFPVLLLLATEGFSFVATRRKVIALACVAVILITNSVQCYFLYKTTHESTNRMACVKWIKQNINPNDKIAVHGFLLDELKESDSSLVVMQTLMQNDSIFKERLATQISVDKEKLKAITPFFKYRFTENQAFYGTKIKLKRIYQDSVDSYNICYFFNKKDGVWPSFVLEYPLESLTKNNDWLVSISKHNNLALVKEFTNLSGREFYIYKLQ